MLDWIRAYTEKCQAAVEPTAIKIEMEMDMEMGMGMGMGMENGSRGNGGGIFDGTDHGNGCLSCECQLHWGTDLGSGARIRIRHGSNCLFPFY